MRSWQCKEWARFSHLGCITLHVLYTFFKLGAWWPARPNVWLGCLNRGSHVLMILPSQKRVSNLLVYKAMNWHLVHTLKCVSPCSCSKRPDAHRCGSSQTADERTIRSIQRARGWLRFGPRRENNHLHWPAGLLGHGLLSGEVHLKNDEKDLSVFCGFSKYFCFF